MQFPPWIKEHPAATAAIVIVTIGAVFLFTRNSTGTAVTTTTSTDPTADASGTALAVAQLQASAAVNQTNAQLQAVQDNNSTQLQVAALQADLEKTVVGAQADVQSLNINQTAAVATANIQAQSNVNLASIASDVSRANIAAGEQNLAITTTADVQNHLSDNNLTLAQSYITAATAPQPNQYQTEATDLYTAILHRAPDASGLAYWTGELQSGTSYAQVQSEFKSAAVADGEIAA